MKTKKKSRFSIVYSKRIWIIFFILLGFRVFFLLYDLPNRIVFGWDQVDNAWAAKRILIDHNFPLLGMQAKLNSGFHIGPAYYYFNSIFYWLFNMQPIAAGICAAVTGIITTIIFFYILKKIFSPYVALVGIFLHTFSFFIIDTDRVPWPVNFIPVVSIIIFYALYKIINGNSKFLLLLAAALGFSLHVHFTSIFYFIIVLCCLPFIPRTKETIKYILYSVPIFAIWVLPIVIAQIENKNADSSNMLSYLSTYFQGFHLVHFFQLTHDAFIELELFLPMMFRGIHIVLVPVFLFIYFSQDQ
jgi:4-amino-4-deoxy-L-arabinose transferase-like glycosyltransferase